MKKLFFLTILACYFTTMLGADENLKADDITYEWLVDQGNKTGYADHVIIFNKIFNKVKVKNLLEFGLGYSTKYFLDYCRKVTSVEFISDGAGPDWYQKCLELFRECPNWTPIAFFTGFSGDKDWAFSKYLGSDSVYRAWAYQGATHKSYAPLDDFYLVELDAFIKRLAKPRPIDVAFVDSGLVMRGDLVQLLFDKVPIIIAHDTCTPEMRKNLRLELDLYGYSRIDPPEEYEEIHRAD
jgi:hypothetical protein